MSEILNNREYRQKVIKDIITQLHDGKSVDEVKLQFEEAFEGVSASEISAAEGALIAEGLPVSEVQRLCDVHAAVFKGSIEEIHQPVNATEIPGHPLNIMMRENRQLEKIINAQIKPYLDDIFNNIEPLKAGIKELYSIDIHYSKKENLVFPYLEKYGVTAPPKVMWGVDDEVRNELKTILSKLSDDDEIDPIVLEKDINDVTTKITEMIFKEENILLPMVLENLTEDEWKVIADESSEIGFIVKNVPEWNPTPKKSAETAEVKEEKKDAGIIVLPSGEFKINELTNLLNTLPFDITFVDKDDIVKYFSQSQDRIFARTKAILGRNVSNCHPPASVHIVEQIVEDFKTGKKDHEDFWISAGEKYIYIRYFALRDENNEYLGVVEVTQDIKPIQEINGEKRLMS